MATAPRNGSRKRKRNLPILAVMNPKRKKEQPPLQDAAARLRGDYSFNSKTSIRARVASAIRESMKY